MKLLNEFISERLKISSTPDIRYFKPLDTGDEYTKNVMKTLQNELGKKYKITVAQSESDGDLYLCKINKRGGSIICHIENSQSVDCIDKELQNTLGEEVLAIIDTVK